MTCSASRGTTTPKCGSSKPRRMSRRSASTWKWLVAGKQSAGGGPDGSFMHRKALSYPNQRLSRSFAVDWLLAATSFVLEGGPHCSDRGPDQLSASTTDFLHSQPENDS